MFLLWVLPYLNLSNLDFILTKTWVFVKINIINTYSELGLSTVFFFQGIGDQGRDHAAQITVKGRQLLD